MIEALVVHAAEDVATAREAAAALRLLQKFALLSMDGLSQPIYVGPSTLRILVWSKNAAAHLAREPAIAAFLESSGRILVLVTDETPPPAELPSQTQMVAWPSSDASAEEAIAALSLTISTGNNLERVPFARVGEEKDVWFGRTIAFGVCCIAASVGAYLTAPYWGHHIGVTLPDAGKASSVSIARAQTVAGKAAAPSTQEGFDAGQAAPHEDNPDRMGPAQTLTISQPATAEPATLAPTNSTSTANPAASRTTGNPHEGSTSHITNAPPEAKSTANPAPPPTTANPHEGSTSHITIASPEANSTEHTPRDSEAVPAARPGDQGVSTENAERVPSAASSEEGRSQPSAPIARGS